ncbi:unnamed protein product [Rodentolepis nana]|uniref:Reverse transcriptase domain-containing protein n=1 Tax=Rodentolepis nana TaxID=102285 RepID=A0A0R3T886_RODNA|nr:unnamed protein product [Rodentolepis nana]
MSGISLLWGYKNTNIAGKEIEDMLHIYTTMKLEQSLTCSWLQATSVSIHTAFPLGFKRHQRAYTPHVSSWLQATSVSILATCSWLQATSVSIHAVFPPGFKRHHHRNKSMMPKVPTKLLWNFKKADWPRFTNLLENELDASPLNFLAWNFKKADWPRFTNLLENELDASPLNFNQYPDKLCNEITNFSQHPDQLCTAITSLPQGDVTSCTLFNVFINDIAKLVQTVTGIKCLLYADVLVLWYSAPKKNAQKRTESAINYALKLLANWFDNNGMVINTANIAFQTFSLVHHNTSLHLMHKDTSQE